MDTVICAADSVPDYQPEFEALNKAEMKLSRTDFYHFDGPGPRSCDCSSLSLCLDIAGWLMLGAVPTCMNSFLNSKYNLVFSGCTLYRLSQTVFCPGSTRGMKQSFSRLIWTENLTVCVKMGNWHCKEKKRCLIWQSGCIECPFFKADCHLKSEAIGRMLKVLYYNSMK